jgi:hypothetical protein
MISLHTFRSLQLQQIALFNDITFLGNMRAYLPSASLKIKVRQQMAVAGCMYHPARRL